MPPQSLNTHTPSPVASGLSRWALSTLSLAVLQVAFRCWVSLLLSHLPKGLSSARKHGFWEQEQWGSQAESGPQAPSWKPAKEEVR